MSKIAWTEKTWNPVVGCTKVSPGCKNCYAEKMAYRLANMGQKKYQHVISTDGGVWNHAVAFNDKWLDKPLHWTKPRKIFVCSMGDLFHESVPFSFIEKVMAVIEECPQHTFQVLTKRADIMAEYFNGLGKRFELSNLPNLWLGTSCENQEMADKRIPILLQIPATVRFVSCEPLLGPIDLNETSIGQIIGPCGESGKYKCDCDCCMGIPSLDWIIVGAESKGQYTGRYCDLEWVQSIIDQCDNANVPCFVKQIPNTDGKLNKRPEVLGYPQQYPKEIS